MNIRKANKHIVHIVTAALCVVVLLSTASSCVLNGIADLYPGWRGTFELDGGETSDVPDFIALGVWYTATLDDGGETWYGVRVTDGSSYEVYFDDRAEGSETYTGDVQVFVTNDGELIEYADAADGYDTPLTFAAIENSVLIHVIAPDAGDGGSFAVGIQLGQ